MNKIRKGIKSTQEEKDRCAFFKAVILPENATKKEILQLETSFQMGEDAKVDYNPIEKYLTGNKYRGITSRHPLYYQTIKSP